MNQPDTLQTLLAKKLRADVVAAGGCAGLYLAIEEDYEISEMCGYCHRLLECEVDIVKLGNIQAEWRGN